MLSGKSLNKIPKKKITHIDNNNASIIFAKQLFPKHIKVVSLTIVIKPHKIFQNRMQTNYCKMPHN